MDVNTVCDALETRLATISGLQVSSEWKDQPNPPAAIALLERVVPTTFANRHSLFFRVLVLTSVAAGIGKAARALNEYVDTTGSTSIKAAIEGDSTLGGTAEDVDTGGAFWDSFGFVELNNATYWGASYRNIEVYVED